MKLPAKTEYGCLAMLYLAEQHALGEPVQIRKVATEHDIPWRFLVQILLELKRAGLVVSTRGAAGGYRLALPPQDINLAEIVSVLEGSEVDPASDPPEEGLRGALHAAYRQAQIVQRDHLAEVTLSDLLEQAARPRDPMWYI